jgi:chemotaxis protein MotB
VLRIDGHTDKVPIKSDRYPSNWELSTARAVSVVKFLATQGIPQDHLAAAGFGEFQPIDKGDDEAALKKNRRIEIRLDQR